MSSDSAIPTDASSIPPYVSPEPYRWPAAVVLHLLPGLLFAAGCVIFRPLTSALGLPHSTGFTLAGLLLVTPFEFAYLARRPQGRSATETVADAAGFRRKLPALHMTLIVVGLITFTAAALVALSPVTSFLHDHVFAALPDWARSSNDDLEHFSVKIVIASLTLNVLGDCLLSPITEELYYRGHLLSRLPARPATAAITGAALFAATHFWEPELVIFVFVVQSLMGLAVQRTRSIRVSIYLHIAVNSITTGVTVLALLTNP